MTGRGRLGLLLALVILGGGLRFWALDFGFPRLLHPDEPTAIKKVLGFRRGDLNPRWFSMPSAYLYLIHFTAKALAPEGLEGNDPYLIGRAWSALLGTLTAAAVYLAGRRLYGVKAGLAAAALTAVLPLHVLISHYATVDAPVTFLIVVSFLFSVRVLRGGGPAWYLLAGAAGGLAAGTKYNGGLVLLPLLAAHFLAGPKRAKIAWLFAGFLAALAVFFLSTPFLIKEFALFRRDLAGQSNYLLRTGHGPIFIATGNGFAHQLLYNLYYAGGWWFWLLSVAGVAGCLVRRRKADWLLLAWILPYLALICVPTVKFARFLLPLTPFLALAAGALLPESRRAPKWLKAVFGLAAAWTLLISLGYLRTLSGPDPRLAADRWLRENLPPGARVGLIKTETGLGFLDDPPLHEPGLKAELVRYERLRPALAARPDFLVVSDFDYRQILRLRERYDLKRYDKWVDFFAGRRGYRRIASFSRPPALGPLVFGGAFPPYAEGADYDPARLHLLPGGQFPPHDMKYNWPLITVFARQAAGPVP